MSDKFSQLFRCYLRALKQQNSGEHETETFKHNLVIIIDIAIIGVVVVVVISFKYPGPLLPAAEVCICWRKLC